MTGRTEQREGQGDKIRGTKRKDLKVKCWSVKEGRYGSMKMTGGREQQQGHNQDKPFYTLLSARFKVADKLEYSHLVDKFSLHFH